MIAESPIIIEIACDCALARINMHDIVDQRISLSKLVANDKVLLQSKLGATLAPLRPLTKDWSLNSDCASTNETYSGAEEL